MNAGNADGYSKEAAHAFASEHVAIRANTDVAVPFAPSAPDLIEQKPAACQMDRRRQLENAPLILRPYRQVSPEAKRSSFTRLVPERIY